MDSITRSADLVMSTFRWKTICKRGYHPIGTEIVRPSCKSTVSVSSVTLTPTIGVSLSVSGTEGIPFILFLRLIT